MRHSFSIGWIAVLELAHEKIGYIVASFAVFSLGLSVLMGQLTYAEQFKITLDFMLAGTHITMLTFSIFMSISLFHRELGSGSIANVLSKPISRGSFLVGKFVGQTAVQFLLCASMGVLTWLNCARFGVTTFSTLALVQAHALIAFEAAMLSAITYLFAVQGGAVTTAIATFAFFLLGHSRDLISVNVEKTPQGFLWDGLKLMVPDLEQFNLKTQASYGLSIGLLDWGQVSIYAVACIVFFLCIAVILFERRDIAT